MDDQDQFCKLPEPLIIAILSLLELKDAVKTGVLAKSWKHLWTQVYNINIVFQRECDDDKDSSYEIGEIKESRWISSVDHTLTQCTATNINKFYLIGYCELSSLVDKWIPYALHKNIKILKLSTYCYAPECLFHSSSITKIELCGVKFYLSSPANMTLLKSLLLMYPPPDEDSINNLLMGCPALEKLVIDHALGLHNINIMSPSVKKFKLNWLENGGNTDFLNIKAPWLQELKLLENFITAKCQLLDVSSLTKTTLSIHPNIPAVDEFDTDYEEEYNNELTQYSYKWIPMVIGLLNSLSYVGELTSGLQSIQVLSLSKLLGTPSPVFKCKHLSVETHLWKFDLPGIVCLLENAPHLETLVVKVVPFWQDMFPLYQMEELFRTKTHYT